VIAAWLVVIDGWLVVIVGGDRQRVGDRWAH